MSAQLLAACAELADWYRGRSQHVTVKQVIDAYDALEPRSESHEADLLVPDIAEHGVSGTRVTCEDLTTGETESTVIRNDYVIVTDGRMEVAGAQVYGNGTVQVTLKKRPASDGAAA